LIISYIDCEESPMKFANYCAVKPCDISCR